MRHLIGLQEPAAGEVFYRQESFTRADPERRQEILRRYGVMLEGGALFSSMTLAENVALQVELTHHLYVPDGDAWIVAQRQFYVSTGYNCEQAVAAFIPVKTGTAVLYVNRTSTDQVVGFGGGAKRSLGSRVLASSLEALFQKARARVAK